MFFSKKVMPLSFVRIFGIFMFTSASAIAQNGDVWTPKTQIPFSAYLGFAFSLDEFGYVGLGLNDGLHTDQVWQYNPNLDTWTRKANFPGGPRTKVATFTVNGKAYVGMGQKFNSEYSDLWEYDPQNDSWTQKASFPGEMTFVNAFSVNGKGYYAAGFSASSEYIAHVWEYDPILDEWNRKADAPLTYPAPEAAVFTIGDRAYLAGGNFWGFGTNHVWEYDPIEDKWLQKADLPVGLSRAVGFSLSDRGFVAGGLGEDGFSESNDLYEYDNETDTWTKRISFGEERSSPFGFAIGCRAYVMASSTSNSSLSFVQEYTPNFPQLSIVADDFICKGDTAVISVSGAETYVWTPELSLLDPLQSATKAFPETTTTYTVTGTDANGCSQHASAIVTVSVPLDLSSDFFSVCGGESVNISANGSSSYLWIAEDSLIVSEQSAISVEPTKDTFYSVSGIDAHGCVSTDTAWVEYKVRPSSDFSFPTEICQADTGRVSFNHRVVDGMSLLWNVDEGNEVRNVKDSTLDVVWTNYGVVNVSLTTQLNGCSSTSVQPLIIKKVPTTDFNLSEIVCEGASAIIQYHGNAGTEAIFAWEFNGGDIVSGNNAGPFSIQWPTFGDHVVELSVKENGCQSKVASRTTRYVPNPKIVFEADSAVCFNTNYEIKFIGDLYTNIEWNFGDASIISGDGETTPFVVNWQSAGTKTIDITIGNDGCTVDTSVVAIIAPPSITPQICIVTVDSETSKNQIIWNNQSSTASAFGIYRETNAANDYSLIDYVDINGGGMQYLDLDSDPTKRSNRYKISVVDTCGVETPLSDYHKTIHLTISRGVGESWNLIWDGYEGFSFSTYRIYRGKSSEAMEFLADVPSNLTSFTDTEAPFGNISYQIEVVKPASCTPSENRGKFATTTRSNVASEFVTEILESKTKVSVSPNPSEGTFTIELTAFPRDGRYEIFDAKGRHVVSGSFKTGNFSVDLSDQAPGIFLMKIITPEKMFSDKIIKK